VATWWAGETIGVTDLKDADLLQKSFPRKLERIVQENGQSAMGREKEA
jgi:hypothetical protein